MPKQRGSEQITMDLTDQMGKIPVKFDMYRTAYMIYMYNYVYIHTDTHTHIYIDI